MIEESTKRSCFLGWLACLMLALPACNRLTRRHSGSAVPYSTSPPVDMTVNERSKNLNSRGLRAFEREHFDKAEKLFRQALEVDLNFGPAHNNLGQVYLARHQLYLAAWEFEYASSLMPELVEPIINQGLAYEMGERIDRAAEFYQQAYDQQPNHPAAIASLVRARIKQDGDPGEIGFLLDELIMHDGRWDWLEWAKELRATKYRDETCDPIELVDGEFGTKSMPFGQAEIQWNAPDSQSVLQGQEILSEPSILEGIEPQPVEQIEIPDNNSLIPAEITPSSQTDDYWQDSPPLGKTTGPMRLPSPTANPKRSANGFAKHKLRPFGISVTSDHLPALSSSTGEVRQASFESPLTSSEATRP